MIFPNTSKYSSSKLKENNFSLNDKIKQQHQATNIIPIYKITNTNSLSKKTLLNDKTPEVKQYKYHNTETNNYSNSPKIKENKNNFINQDSYKQDFQESNKYSKFNHINNDSSESKEKNLRIPLQNIKNNYDRKKIFSAKYNEKKTKNKFSLNNNNIYNNTNYTTEQKNNSNNNNLDNSKNSKEKVYKANLERVRISKKAFGCVEGYAAITTEGIVRGYNEDRVSIILNIPQPPNFKGEIWPKCSFFAIYDGHGGSACADFLRDNLHKFVNNLLYINLIL
jgi:hypothetical protein